MFRSLVGAWLILGVGCARTSPLPTAEDDCTLATPLVPGVPGSPGHLLPSELNPNGASELAALMRRMVADVEQARADVLAGRPSAPLWARHRKMRCAWPTDVSDRTATFDAMAVTYLEQVRALDTHPSSPREALNQVVGACRACHETSCPGPIERIEQLRLAAEP